LSFEVTQLNRLATSSTDASTMLFTMQPCSILACDFSGNRKKLQKPGQTPHLSHWSVTRPDPTRPDPTRPDPAKIVDPVTGDWKT